MRSNSNLKRFACDANRHSFESLSQESVNCLFYEIIPAERQLWRPEECSYRENTSSTNVNIIAKLDVN